MLDFYGGFDVSPVASGEFPAKGDVVEIPRGLGLSGNGQRTIL
jgi:hypothetical protein